MHPRQSTTAKPADKGRITPDVRAMLALVAAVVVLPAAIALSTGRAASGPLAQATAVPPIATCVPTATPGTPPPPGLYPIVYVDHVTIVQDRGPDGCPTGEMRLRVCLRNDGPAPSGPFPLRISGCGVGRVEVTVDDVAMINTHCVEVAGAQIPPDRCRMMIDTACAHPFFERHWSGDVPHPMPAPTCTPAPRGTATSTTMPSATTTAATPTPAAHPEIPDLRALVVADRIGGDATTVTVSGTLIALGVGERVSMLDASDPERMIVLARGPTVGDSGVTDLAWHGDTVWAATHGGGVLALDVSAPSSPTVLGMALAIPDVRSIALSADGRLLLAAADDSLVVVDASARDAPRVIARLPARDRIRDVALDGAHAYIADGPGITVVDLSSPSAPVPVGRALLRSGEAQAIAIAGDRIVVALGHFGARLLARTEPDQLRDEGQLDTKATWRVAAGPGMVLAGTASRLRVYDMSGDEARWVGDLPDHDGIRSLRIHDHRLYLARGAMGLAVLAWEPGQLERWSTLGTHHWPAAVEHLHARGDELLVADGRHGLFAVRIDAAGQGTVLWRHELGSEVRSVTTRGDLVLAVRRRGITMLHAPVGGRPRVLAQLDTARSAHDAVLLDHRATVALEGQLLIVDLSDPEQPLELGSADLPVDNQRLIIRQLGDHVVIAGGDAGIFVATWSGPDAPRIVGSLPFPPSPTGSIRAWTALAPGPSGRWLGVAASSVVGGPSLSLAHTLDLRDPTAPAIAGALDLASFTRAAIVRGDTGLLASSEALTTLDLRRPTLLHEIASRRLQLPITPRDVALLGPQIVVGGSGLVVLRPMRDRLWLPVVDRNRPGASALVERHPRSSHPRGRVDP